MAAPNAISAPFSLQIPERFPLFSSSPTQFLAIHSSKSNQQLANNPLKPISRTVLPPMNSYRRKGNLRIFSNEHKNERLASLKPCVSAHQESQPHQRNNEDGLGINDSQVPENAANQRHPPDLKSLLQAYKEAFLVGDQKTICEIENMIMVVKKEKNVLVQKVSALSEEISLGKQNCLRLTADFDNYRKRSEKEKLTVRTKSQEKVIESLLSMVDSFERARQQIVLQTEKEKKIDTSYQGIYKQFVETLRSLRVAVVPSVGKPFDPSMHEAIGREESREYKEGIITQELRRGFYLGDRILRPAKVKVSSGPGKPKPTHSAPEPASSVAGADNR